MTIRRDCRRAHRGESRRGATTRVAALLAALAVAAGCATTTIDVAGTQLAGPLCSEGAPQVVVAVYWRPEWRADQKEPALREEAAARGIRDFLARSPCLAATTVVRVPAPAAMADADLLRWVANDAPAAQRVLAVVVRELGPRLVVGGPTGIEGGTEVLVDLRVLDVAGARSLAQMRTHWRDGGSFVVKGVATLDRDLAAALAATLLRPSAGR